MTDRWDTQPKHYLEIQDLACPFTIFFLFLFLFSRHSKALEFRRDYADVHLVVGNFMQLITGTDLVLLEWY